jgi:aminodeoxyfutalosine deaminase
MRASLSFHTDRPVQHEQLSPTIASLPKAELHVHLEGSIRPFIAVTLAARHGFTVTEEEVRSRYASAGFMGFIEAFKWVTSFLRTPADFALVATDLATQLLAQSVIYAEVTLSVGVMLLRNQNPQANFEAVLAAVEAFEHTGLQLNWIFDAVRQFGPEPALQVVDWARRCHSPRIVAFGIGGDELSVPTKQFQDVYRHAAACGLHRLIHAGEIGGPERIREAVELLASQRTVLEICPVSNLRTGALARQLKIASPSIKQHPLPQVLRHGVPVVLSTDDPAMFDTHLANEYLHAQTMGLTEPELNALVQNGFTFSFTH